MQFEAHVNGENYQFNYINATTVLVSGHCSQYIIYKSRRWNCADEIAPELLVAFANVIEQHLHVTT